MVLGQSLCARCAFQKSQVRPAFSPCLLQVDGPCLRLFLHSRLCTCTPEENHSFVQRLICLLHFRRRSFARCFAYTLLCTCTMIATAGTYIYITRIIPALSLLVLLTIIIFSLVIEPYGQNSSSRPSGPAAATSWQLVLSAYTVLLHLSLIHI